MTTVTMAHVRAIGFQQRTDGKTFCASGIREWCDRHGIDYLELVRQGIPSDRLRETDGLGLKAAELADAEAAAAAAGSEGETDGRE